MEPNNNNPDQTPCSKKMDNDRSYETTDQILHWFCFSKSMSNTKWILDLKCIYRNAVKFSFGKFYKTEKKKRLKWAWYRPPGYLPQSLKELNGRLMAEICI